MNNYEAEIRCHEIHHLIEKERNDLAVAALKQALKELKEAKRDMP